MARMAATVRACRFENTSAPTGGGIYVYDWSSLNLVDTTFLKVRANNFGSALSVRFSILQSEGCSISDARTNDPISQGGAVFLEKCSADISRLSLSDCRAGSGAGIAQRGGRLVMKSSALLACQADSEGGGLFLTSDAFATISDGRFSNCRALAARDSGHAARLVNSEALFSSTTFKEFPTTNLDELVSRTEDSCVSFENCSGGISGDRGARTTHQLSADSAPHYCQYGYGHPWIIVFLICWGILTGILLFWMIQEPHMVGMGIVLGSLAITVLPLLYDRQRVLIIDDVGIHDHSPLQKVDVPWNMIREAEVWVFPEQDIAFKDFSRFELRLKLKNGTTVLVVRCDKHASEGRIADMFQSACAHVIRLQGDRK